MARKILLADDSVTAQNMGRKILADAGYEVIAVNNGSAALKKIAELKPDLVILDVYMPGYSGLEVCQRLKESQETSRIPVLLSVGKLEPFKPEEAQRVRADGYIVKPFEASELLSALSKLEDKVVPRAEPSKPGRFARAMAAADDSDRSGKNEPSSTETGWKNRISFPHKTDGEETVAEEAQSANRSGEKSANKKDKRHPAAAETSVDVAAFAPIGVPKDVTPAEVAAITAAAAQMQMAEAVTAEDRKSDSRQSDDRNSDDRRRSATPVSQAAVPQATSEFAVEPVLERFQDSRADEIQSNSSAEINAKPESEASHEPTNVAAASSEPPTAESGHRRNPDEKLAGEKLVDEKPVDEKMEEDAPVTMAAASASAVAAIAGSPRWTAVPVPLASDEAAISLDHEMQKAYAAFAAADYATSAGTVEAETNNSSAQPEATVETPVPATPIDEPVAAISNSDPAALPAPQLAAEANIETQPSPDLPQKGENLAPAAEFVTPAPITEVVDSAPEMHAAPQPESPVAPLATESTNAFAPIAENSEPKLDSDAVKTTAAAWASWRQIRDTSKSDQEPQPQPQDSAPPESASPDSAALAVAAGAEQALLEASSAAPTGNPSDVASIVESVLAGLRPKLMEEITRKMAEKK